MKIAMPCQRRYASLHMNTMYIHSERRMSCILCVLGYAGVVISDRGNSQRDRQTAVAAMVWQWHRQDFVTGGK